MEGTAEKRKLTRSLGSCDAIEFEVLVMVMSAAVQLTSVWKKSARVDVGLGNQFQS
jgi:hypothetical protein